MARVNYDENNWRKVSESLLYEDKYSGIDVLTRANLISDMFALAEIGELPYDHVLDTMKYLIREDHYIVWKVAATAFEKFWFHLRGTKLLKLFEVSILL